MNQGIQFWLRSKTVALFAMSALLMPILAGCGTADQAANGANLPPVDDTVSGNQPVRTVPEEKKGMSTTTKVALLAGAAALYYMYNKNKQKRAAGDTSQPQYYLSKNGRVYYRDSSGRAHWVTPPPQGIQIPWDEAQQYRDFQGFNRSSSGRTLENWPGATN